MVLELSRRVSWICLLFGLATGFPAAFPAVERRDYFSSSGSAPEAPSPRAFYMPPKDKTVSFPVHSQTGMSSSSGGTGLGVFSSGGGGAGSKFFSSSIGPGSSFFSSGIGPGSSFFSSGIGPGSSFFSDGPGYKLSPGSSVGSRLLSAGSGVGSGAFSTGLGFAAGLFGQLLALGSNLVRARPLSLGQAWRNNLQVAIGSVQRRPQYVSSYVVHSNRGYKRERDGRTDAKYVTDTFGQISPPVIQNGGTGSKGQQVYRG